MSPAPGPPDPVEAWRLVLGAVLALLAALAVEFGLLALVAVVARLSGWRAGVGMSLLLVAGSLFAWAVGGAVAVEVAEDGRGAWAAAAVPPLLALVGLALSVVVGRAALDTALLAAAASAFALGVAAYGGGRVWATRIRHRDTLQ